MRRTSAARRHRSPLATLLLAFALVLPLAAPTPAVAAAAPVAVAATPTLAESVVAGFTDLPYSYWAWQHIQALYAEGITRGCGEAPLAFCPEAPVTRAEMAVFLIRASRGVGFTPQPATGKFGDVPASYWAAAWIEQLAADGITAGCSVTPANYCPEAPVTRAEMAVFLVRALHGTNFTPPPPTGLFGDVPTTHWAAAWIEQLLADGVTAGCSASPVHYCPEGSVTRAQMAVFLIRAFNTATPQPVLLGPAAGAVVSTPPILDAALAADGLSSFDIRSARFEYSPDGQGWFPISEARDLFNDVASLDLNRWDALWLSDPLPSGQYQLRVQMETLAGRRGTSAVTTVTVNKPPTPVATLQTLPPIGTTAAVVLDASASSDPENSAMTCTWQTGDTVIGTTCVLPQLYPADTPSPIPLILTVTDAHGAAASAYYQVVLSGSAPPTVTLQDQNEVCICEKLDLVVTGEALGPDGADADPDRHWPPRANAWDGAALGPLDGNPGNPAASGEHPRTGFAFELVCTVKGNPAKCRETQLVKATLTLNGVAIAPSWSGAAADRDLDGASDLKANAPQDCEAHGGTWDAGRNVCRWPQTAGKYRPDTPFDGPSLYTAPFAYKAHSANTIVWFDAPSFAGGENGSTLKADFIAIVRGTDGNYCYKTFSLDLERRSGQDREILTQTGGADGAGAVPGVP